MKNQSCPKRNEEAVLSVRVQPGGQPMMLFPARSPPSFHPLTYNAEHVRPGQSRFCSASALRRWVRRSRVRLLLPLPAAPGGPGRPAGGPPGVSAQAHQTGTAGHVGSSQVPGLSAQIQKKTAAPQSVQRGDKDSEHGELCFKVKLVHRGRRNSVNVLFGLSLLVRRILGVSFFLVRLDEQCHKKPLM